jgi:hypothetical protein
MEKEKFDDSLKAITRREFCNKAIKRSSIVAAAGVAGYFAYKKPAVKSFFGIKDAYAYATQVNGKFSLKGDVEVIDG